MSAHIWKWYIILYIYICMHNKWHIHGYIINRLTDSSYKTQRHFQLLMFLSLGRNVIFHNNEVIVYFFLAILSQELDILVYLFYYHEIIPPGVLKAQAKQCFLIPRRHVLSHGNTHCSVSFLLDTGKQPIPYPWYNFVLPLVPHLYFPSGKIFYRALEYRIKRKKK